MLFIKWEVPDDFFVADRDIDMFISDEDRFISERKFKVADIIRHYGVPLSKVKGF
jgi:hypothetical protein